MLKHLLQVKQYQGTMYIWVALNVEKGGYVNHKNIRNQN